MERCYLFEEPKNDIYYINQNTIKHKHEDHETLKPANQMPKIDYPKPDGIITFDKTSSVYLTGTNHTENQPVHLKLKDPELPVNYTLNKFD